MKKQKKCNACKYSCRISFEGGDRFCQYILITGTEDHAREVVNVQYMGKASG